MSFKYCDRMCFERYTTKNGAWKLEELLADKNVLSVIKTYGIKKNKKEICAKLEEILKEKKKVKVKKVKKPIRIEIESDTDSEEEVIEDEPKIKNKLIQKCKIYSECPRGYTRKNLVDLAIECGVSIKDGKKSANMKMICENMKKRYGFKDDDLPSKPKVRSCKNRETSISMTDVDDIDDIKYIRLSNGYCYDIDELVQTMIMSKDRNINPSDPSNLTPIWMNEIEKESIINHEGLDKSIRKSYKAMVDIERKSDEKILESIASDSSTILNMVAETGFHCLNDNITSWAVDDPELFQKAQKMLIELRNKIHKSKFKVFYERMHVGMLELGTTLDNAHLECIHGVGLKLLTIYCTFFYRVSRIKSLKLSPFVYRIVKGGNEFIVSGMEEDPEKKERVKTFYLTCISVDNSFAKNIGKLTYDRYSKDYLVLSALDTTPDWIKYLKKNKEILVTFFSQLQSISPKKMISPDKEEKKPPKKMSKKIVEIEFESDSEGEEEKSTTEYDEIKSLVKKIESAGDEVSRINLKHKLNDYIFKIDFFTLTRDKKIDQEFQKIFSDPKYTVVHYDNMIERSKEQNKMMKVAKEFNSIKNTPFKSLPDIYIKVVLGQVHPDSGITSDGISKVKELLTPLIPKFDLGKYPPKDDRVETVKKNIEEILPEDLGRHALSELRRNIARDESLYIRHVVIEYLLAEILELSGNLARDKKKVKITSEFISKAIEGDEELNSFFNSVKDKDEDEHVDEEEEESSEVTVCDFYDSIDNEYRIFSNYADTPVKIDGVVWPTTEHYYHAEKFSPSSDEDIAWYQEKIRSASTANKSKMLGNQKVTGRFGTGTFLSPADKTPLKDIIDESKERGVSMRKDWEKVKDSVMYKAVKAKLEQHPQVKKTLLSTGTCIIREASPTDLYWGIGKDCKGKNMLGVTYMKLRDEYKGVKRTMDDYKKMTESAKGVALTEGSKSKSKVKSTRAYEVYLKVEGSPSDFPSVKKEILDLLSSEDISKYTVTELKSLIGFFNSLFNTKGYTKVGKKKADLVNDLKSLMKKGESDDGVEDDEEEPAENKIKTVDGDLLSYVKTHYIVHQCNAVTDKAKGLAETIFKKFPEADIYSDGTKRKLGDVFIRGKIINLVGQHYPGEARYPTDTPEKRIAAFKKGLETIAKKIPSDSSIAFPYNIGCGLAKGEWNVYEKMVQDFADKNKGLKVLLVAASWALPTKSDKSDKESSGSDWEKSDDSSDWDSSDDSSDWDSSDNDAKSDDDDEDEFFHELRDSLDKDEYSLDEWTVIIDKALAHHKKRKVILSDSDVDDLVEFLSKRLEMDDSKFDEISDSIKTKLLKKNMVYKDGDKESYMSLVRDKGYISKSEHDMMDTIKYNKVKVVFRDTEFPVDEKGRYTFEKEKPKEDLSKLTVKKLRELLNEKGLFWAGQYLKDDLIAALEGRVTAKTKAATGKGEIGDTGVFIPKV
ncbi:MAG: NADAR domain-containing protein [Candidatus Colwellbacteria bacterium]|nr:NADAR domain-containing protein [Candidatus Colwellbacteria bacterium]